MSYDPKCMPLIFVYVRLLTIEHCLKQLPKGMHCVSVPLECFVLVPNEWASYYIDMGLYVGPLDIQHSPILQ